MKNIGKVLYAAFVIAVAIGIFIYSVVYRENTIGHGLLHSFVAAFVAVLVADFADN